MHKKRDYTKQTHETICCARVVSHMRVPSTGGGGNLPWFWVRMCGWSPRTPPHSYTRPSEKHDPFIYFPYRKLTPFIYYFWKLTPFIYYFSNFTHSYTFRVKKIPHWYTFDVKMIPIHILGGLKSIPYSSRTSVYTFIMEVTPSWFQVRPEMERKIVLWNNYDYPMLELRWVNWEGFPINSSMLFYAQDQTFLSGLLFL